MTSRNAAVEREIDRMAEALTGPNADVITVLLAQDRAISAIADAVAANGRAIKRLDTKMTNRMDSLESKVDKLLEHFNLTP